jgi:hypothetical protein
VTTPTAVPTFAIPTAQAVPSGLVATAACPIHQGSSTASPYAPSTNAGAVVGEHIAEMPHWHLSPPETTTYNHNPPTSGCHYSIAGRAPIAAGVHGVVADPYWVHNLEHGYMAVFYSCPDGCAADEQRLRDWYDGLGPDPLPAGCSGGGDFGYPKVIVMPRAAMPHRFAAVVWNYAISMDQLDTALLDRFRENHLGHGPEPCAG